MDKLKYFAITVSLVVALTAAFYGCNHGSSVIASECDFGLIDDVIRFSDSDVTTCVTGDIDRLCPLSVSRTQRSSDSFSPYVFFDVASDTTIALTSRCYQSGCVLANTKIADHEFGYIEKKTDAGSWDYYGEVTYATADGLIPETVPFIVLEKGTASVAVGLPWYDSGEYRITYFFREYTDDGDGGYRTGQELYSVSHEYYVPEISEKECDLLAVSISDSSNSKGVRLAIRSNNGAAPYMSCRDVLIERLSGESWLSDSVSADVPSTQTDYKKYDYMFRLMQVKNQERYMISPKIHCIGVESGHLYRLTVRFTENEDGSGEQYTLTLNLRFDE